MSKDETQKYQFEAVAATVGRFTFKLLTNMEQARSNRVAVEIYGGPLDSGANLAITMAELETALVEKPDSFDIRGGFDDAQIFEVWAAYTLARSAFRKTLGSDAAK